VRRIRNPWHANEGQTRKPEENETPEQKQFRDTAYVVFERFEKEHDVFNKLDVICYRFILVLVQTQINLSTMFDP